MPTESLPIDALVALAYGLPIVGIYAAYALYKSRQTKTNKAILAESVSTGMTEPASLHPLINQNICIGCGSCVNACPESKHQVLGLINNKAELINPTACIGHGACKTACPADAIELVFGTERRGMDIPNVGPDFQTNMPGIYIAGELGGMGLIKNATEQGRQALDAIAESLSDASTQDGMLDLVIVGAGPAGVAATLGAMEKKLKSVTVEQDSLGGTVAHFPRGKIVMTAPAKLPIVGEFSFRETTKETLIDFWQDVEKSTGMQVNYQEGVADIQPLEGGGYCVTTTKTEYRTRTVLLAIGRRGTPRKLDVPGEDQTKVVYRLNDPADYQHQHVMIVGGGDSALEAATTIADEPGTTVTLSYRSGAFSRAKQKNRERVDQAVASGKLNVMLSSNIQEIGADTVTITDEAGETHCLDNNGIIICAGGILPNGFLKAVGINVETKFGTA